MSQTPSIAIVGAGPSGLVLARLLEINGIKDYVVYERDESSIPGPWQQGGSLDLHGPTGQMALQKAGLYEKFQEYARWDASVVNIIDTSGKTLARMGEGRDAPEIDRLQLRQLLLDSLPAHKILWGHGVTSVERHRKTNDATSNGYTIFFRNGKSATGFKLIVGADGTWSKIRPLITSARPIYSGKMFIEGKVSVTNPSYKVANELAGPGMMMAATGHRHLYLQASSDGSYRMYVGLQVAEDFYQHRNGSPQEQTKRLQNIFLSEENYFATWAPHLKALISDSEGAFRAWHLFSMKPEEVSWSREKAPGVTLLGDAAHVSTPFVGEGVNCSMADGVYLAEQLIAAYEKDSALPTDILEHAIVCYEKEMFERGQDLIRRSAESEQMMFGDEGMKTFLDVVTNEEYGLAYDMKIKAAKVGN